jgi:hypothetical protein
VYESNWKYQFLNRKKENMRAAAETDFSIPLPEVGEFVFARRKMGDMIKIRATFLVAMRKLSGDGEGDYELDKMCGFTAAYQILIVSCPKGWEDASAIDWNSNKEKILELANLLSEKEFSFRRQPNK